MTLRGTIRNGHIETDREIDLPEGTRVNIEPASTASSKRSSTGKPAKDPAFRIGDIAVPMGVRDLAAQHDHYLYGTPKRASAKKTSRTKARRSKKGRR